MQSKETDLKKKWEEETEHLNKVTEWPRHCCMERKKCDERKSSINLTFPISA